MSDDALHLQNAPIIEAVLDIDCELPPTFELEGMEPQIRTALGERYPMVRKQMLHEHHLLQKPEAPPELSVRRGLQALQFVTDDDKQIVQFRKAGYSFNRLAPYSRLDEYMPEIERTWTAFQTVAHPILVRKIGLRTINRIPIPLLDGRASALEEYLRVCPRLPDEDGLAFTGFLNHHAAVERSTGNAVNIVMTTQSATSDALPLILDIDAYRAVQIEPSSWATVQEVLTSLRALKNRVFRNTLTEKCLNLFSPLA